MERLPNEMIIDELGTVKVNSYRDNSIYSMPYALGVVCIFNNCKLEKGV